MSSSANAPAEARAFAEQVAAPYDLASRSNLALVVSELVTRSVVDGSGEKIDLRLTQTGEDVLRGELRGRAAAGLDGLAETREGIISARIIDQLVLGWGYDKPRGTAWFEVRVSADR